MAKCFLTKRWIKLTGILSIASLVYVARFCVKHIPQEYVLFHGVSENLRVPRILSVVTAVERSTLELNELHEFTHLSTFKGKHVQYTDHIIKSNRTEVWKLKYKNFNIPAPLFASKRSRILFFKNAENRALIGARSEETLKGEVYLVRNGSSVYSENVDCGYRSDPAHVLVNRNISTVNWFHKAVAITSPEAWNFQHFMDGALPKMIQSLCLLQDPNITFLFPREPRDEIITEILDRLNLTRHRIAETSTNAFGADYFYYTCIAPPIHPVLWQTARRMIGVPETLLIPTDHAFIVFVTRKGCLNCGRVIRNENDVISMLRKRYGETRVRLFIGDLKLKGVIDLFGNARIVMGSHGGGMYNINFAPTNTTVVEFMPTRPDGTMLAMSNTIIWSQASLLGQVFWRMSIPPVHLSKDDMVVDLRELKGILDATDIR